MNFDAKALRDQIVKLLDDVGLIASCKVDVADSGKYETQRGSFIVHARDAVLGVTVWEFGVVEIQPVLHSGDQMEAVTLENGSIELAASQVVALVRQHT